MTATATGNDRFGVTPDPLPVAEIHEWAVRPDCGAVVVFTGTVRDHAEGRDDVAALEYEAWEGPAIEAFTRVAEEARRRYPATGRIAILHRTGTLALSEAAVVVAVSAPHRAGAFDAARWIMDAVKSSAPVWKKEHWAGGARWGTGARDIVDPSLVGGAS
jgi:molybdopterin synthase catalytic subunit